MKILSYKIEDGMIKVTTNNKDRPKFVYFVDKFATKAQLVAEIEKSILLEEKKTKIKKEKKDKLEKELKNA